MLPGFRFLFAAIVLSMSILVFGLGAAALLRAAHEQFASIPSRWAPPEPVFAKPNEAPVPTLALLRFDPPVMDKAPDDVPAAVVPEAVAPAEPGKLAALKPEDSMLAEAVRPDPPTTETTTAAAAMPSAVVESEAPVSADEVKVAAIADAPPPAAATVPAVVEPVAEAASLEVDIAATRIATLGGPAVAIEETGSAKAADIRPDRSAARKRAKERRRIARRARLARQVAAAAAAAAGQPPADPFAPTPVARPR